MTRQFKTFHFLLCIGIQQRTFHKLFKSFVKPKSSEIACNKIICRRPNFENPKVNVGLPVFTIHGNHDDPAGVDNLSAVDILSSCNLVNYFGKSVSPTIISINHQQNHWAIQDVLVTELNCAHLNNYFLVPGFVLFLR